MNWMEFSKNINGVYNEKYDVNLGGDVLLKEIIQITKDGRTKITKKTRRGYEASSHMNVEKFEIEFRHNHLKFNKNRLRRKYWLSRIFRDQIDHYKIDGLISKTIENIVGTKEIKTLLNHSNSEFYSIENLIVFKCQSLGKMHEDLNSILSAFDIVKSFLITER